ncbi:hypothetical protein F2Q68_00012122 [Brassica cretica]|uniref:Uncharacterized protein n=1 Tax=Brassica cretica TaxID=69181 RepID=A0A8S9KWT2_BRACR|nr:hypothetical protein F2Q68_00012122 [Brassica cretica]
MALMESTGASSGWLLIAAATNAVACCSVSDELSSEGARVFCGMWDRDDSWREAILAALAIEVTSNCLVCRERWGFMLAKKMLRASLFERNELSERIIEQLAKTSRDLNNIFCPRGEQAIPSAHVVVVPFSGLAGEVHRSQSDFELRGSPVDIEELLTFGQPVT